MAAKGKVAKIVGAIIGLALMAAAVYSVCFIDWKTEAPPEPKPVRPLKTMVIESSFAAAPRKYPGKVQANQSVDLSFQVGGPLIELLVKKGQEVEEGALLARIDPRDFENNLASAKADYNKAKEELERNERAVKTGAVSQTALTSAKAAFEKAEAGMNIAQKALDDTYLYAKFSGTIANKYVVNYQDVQAKQAILSLQDISSVEIDVAVPEGRVAAADVPEEGEYKAVVRFEYLPGREYEVKLKEYTTEADPLTQTYLATFVMPAPEDVQILPGMTATIWVFLLKDRLNQQEGFPVPVDAVPVDGQGVYFVWKVVEKAGKHTVQRMDVKVGEMMADEILVVEGLAKGDRIATAGVHLLYEGQEVRLLQPKAGEVAE